ncbi:Uncharacterised protein [Serratia odorifera]|uniref:Uncharacterized protein n=1 Tax=Serratia odorifera TaxID=618 RepID=A0A447KS55_SEROD|nr:Uncharacterised protein [Serratia odorifera]
MMATLGPQGYGEQRAAALLREGADPQDIAWVQSAMRQLNPPVFSAPPGCWPMTISALI